MTFPIPCCLMQTSRPGVVPSKVDDKPHHNQLVCQQPYYHNCRLLAPDGTLLSIVSRKKLDWYLERDLGGMCVINYEHKLC